MNISAEVKLTDLSEGDDVDALNVTTANLGGNADKGRDRNVAFLLRKGEQWIRLCKSHTVGY